MMTAIRINKVGKSFPTRQAARTWANENGGQVIDMAKRDPGFVESQLICDKYNIPNKSSRWIVLFSRIICRRYDLANSWTSPTMIGNTKVISKKGYLGNIARKDRLLRITGQQAH